MTGHSTSARPIFRGLMAQRRMYARGTPNHQYLTRAARKVLWVMAEKPVSEWTE